MKRILAYTFIFDSRYVKRRRESTLTDCTVTDILHGCRSSIPVFHLVHALLHLFDITECHRVTCESVCISVCLSEHSRRWSSREVEEAHDVVVGAVGQRVGDVAGRVLRHGAARGAVADRLKTFKGPIQ